MEGSLRSRVITLYKTLLHLGKDYPAGYPYFRDKTHNAFMKNKNHTDPEKIERLMQFGEYICAELRAMYSLKKYRTMKQRYYQDPEDEELKPKPTKTGQDQPKT